MLHGWGPITKGPYVVIDDAVMLVWMWEVDADLDGLAGLSSSSLLISPFSSSLLLIRPKAC